MKNWVYRLAAWFAGGLLLGCVVATVMVDDPVVPAGLQGKQWIWLSEALLVALPFWAAGGNSEFSFHSAYCIRGRGMGADVWGSGAGIAWPGTDCRVIPVGAFAFCADGNVL